MAWLLMLLHLFLFHFLSLSSFNFSCHHEESSALLQFKSSFTINSESYYLCDESLLKTATWKNGTDCCSWHGVTCDTTFGRVIGLNLGCEGLQGIFHPNSTLFHLAHIQKLNLSYNDFTGSHFHSKFGGFQSLTHLYLSGSCFKGKIPTQISHLSKLQSLHLSGYFGCGLVWKETILKRFLLNATNLQELFLNYTNMSSIRPNSIAFLFNQSSSLVTLNLKSSGLRGKFKRSILCLPSIQEIDMSFNDELQGQLPELSCSTSLRILDLSACGFEGEIPTMSFFNLTYLTSLTLSYNHLNGSIPSSLIKLPRLTSLDLYRNKLSGRIPNVFQTSNKFQVLDLSDNKFEGELPTSLSNLQHLIRLDLSYNLFRGTIPDMFSGMTKLQELNLYFNSLEGQIPSSLFNLTSLMLLFCSHNKLEGPLPNKTNIGLQKLTDLGLNDNLLNGTIPSSLFSLPSLVNLYLSNNRLTGPIGATSSYSLENLSLHNNKLQGNIPESIYNLTNLANLILSSNDLSGFVNFQHFSKLTNLRFLSLSWNSQLSLNFEYNVNNSVFYLEELELSSVNLIKFSKLQGKFPNLDYLDLSNNKLDGRMPNWLHEKNSLKFLNLSQNLFMSIDQWININRSNGLSGLDLSGNLLDGEIPLVVCNISSLEFLNLGYNNLTGIIPQCLAESTSLQVLNLQMNRFHGTLPSNFPKHSKIVSLNLYGNRLEGRFPKSLSRCKKLEFLNLGVNKIEDNFPDFLQTMQDLKVLVLRDNKLHGSLVNLKIKHSFQSLIIFDISGNNLGGFLPKVYLRNYEAMKNVNQVDGDSSLHYLHESYEKFDAGYSDSVTVATKGIQMKLVKIPIKFVSIDFSRNKFEGEIPNAIGELHELKGLNLSHNRLTGHIPKSIGNLTNLESLDLSLNMLTGVIPAELTNLNFLEVMNLSNNHLVGRIPQGKQFNTFTNDSYEGNLGLCGFPLSKRCGLEQHTPPSPSSSFWSEEKFGFGWIPVAIGYGCGFVIGIGIGYCMFLIGKPRWLVMIFGGQPKRKVKRRTKMRRNHGTTMNQNQNVQMS